MLRNTEPFDFIRNILQKGRHVFTAVVSAANTFLSLNDIPEGLSWTLPR